MKYIKYFSVITLGLILLGGCRGKEKLFVDPSSPGAATPATQLTEIEVATINSYEGDINRIASIFIQHNAGTDGQSVESQVYSNTQQGQDNNWAQLYATLKNGKELRTNFGAKNPYYDGITEILMVMNFGLLTDIYGDVPFTEALQGGGNFYPKFDQQEAILSQFQVMLDDAIAKLALPASDNLEIPGDDDLIYSGDIDKWTKAAYTLKARYLNRLSRKPAYNATAILTALSNGIQSAGDDMMGVHGGDNGQNQWYAFQNNRPNYMFANATLVDSMKLRPTDERLYYYFDSTGIGDVIGSPLSPTTTNASLIGAYVAGSPDVSTPMITFAEAKFIEAEAKVRSGNATAFSALNDGIQASAALSTGGSYTGANIATYTAGNTNLHAVMYEKWIAMFGQVEAYNDYRRTGIPALTPNPSGAIPTIPGRFPMSQQERNGNPNTIALPISTPVWWAQ